MTKKIIALIMAVICLFLCSCGGKKASEPVSHTVSVVTEGGMSLSEFTLKVYSDSDLSDLIWAGGSNNEGVFSFEAIPSDSYVAVINGLGAGYAEEEFYPLTGVETTLTLATALQKVDDLSTVSYKVGSVAPDFEVKSYDGEVYILSELLKEKKAVVLNFWFLKCDPCRMEFPYLEEAYKEYSDSIEVIAINPMDGTDESVAEYARELGLTFPCAVGDAGWQNALNIAAYPTTVVIDRYGHIAMKHMGAATDKETFTDIFEFFGSDEYEQTTVKNLSDIH